MLPGLAPNHTRGGFIGGNRLWVENFASTPGDFAKTEDGLWLLPSSVAEREVREGASKLVALANLAISQDSESMGSTAERYLDASDALTGATVDELGCITGALTMAETPEAQALALAELEMGTFSLDELGDLSFLRTCGNSDCYSSRHFDFRFGRTNLQERRVESNPDWYKELASGKIKTAWGDTLPSVAKSLEEYIKLQRRCFPYVKKEKSILTPGSMSQVRFQPFTGCWEAWSYYCRPDNNGASWQFDGYGRLYQRITAQKVDAETGEITKYQRRGHWLAHRVVWAATPRRWLEEGKVLNHLCSYRRCCNPYHIEQVEPSVNVRHGVRVQQALRDLGSRTASADNYLSAEELVPYHEVARQMYFEICKAKGLEA